RSWKLPKPDSLTLSPASSAMRISSKNRSTMSLASRLLRPSCSNSRSASSALVRVMGVLLAKSAAEPVRHDRKQLGHCGVDFRVRQSTFSIPHKHKNRNAFLSALDAAATVYVKDADSLHVGWRGVLQGIEQRLCRHVAGHDDRH